MQLREGPDGGHRLTIRCSGLHLQVCPCRTRDEGCCCCSVESRRQKKTVCTGVFLFARMKVLQQRVLQQRRLLLLRVLPRHEEAVIHRKPSDRVVNVAELCK